MDLHRSSELFQCPQCNDDNPAAIAWTAHYMTPESQGVVLWVGPHGLPEEGEYDGCTRSYDSESNDFYECDNCGYQMNPDGTEHVPITDKWKQDAIQFPRLLAEIMGAGLTPEQDAHLCETMDLTENEIFEIFERADRTWQRIKVNLTKGE